jgi:hypothetical protein
MKKTFLIAVGLMLSIVSGCAVVDKAKDVTEYVETLKEKGCDALSESSKSILVAVIKTKVAIYPDNGICNPEWVRDVLLDKLDLLETPDVQNESAQLGYKADSRYGFMDQSSAVTLLLSYSKATDNGASRVQQRPGIYSEDRSFFYASRIVRDQSRGSGSRLHLYRPV